VDESRQWAEFGRWLVEQREQAGLRRRDAARKAKVSEAVWRDLETGRKPSVSGIRLLPNPSRAILERIAAVLDVPVEELVARSGRPNGARRAGAGEAGTRVGAAAGDVGSTSQSADPATSSLVGKIRRLGERDLLVVERLVDAMLEDDST
jgi:transcriptional regulator with XRE-family HTH domain